MRNLRIVGRRSLVSLVVATAVGLVGAPASSSAAPRSPGTGWAVASAAYPTNLPPGGTGNIQIFIQNTGAGASSGPITVSDTLPKGLVATEAGGVEPFSAAILSGAEEEEKFGGARWACSGTKVVVCKSNPAVLPTIPVGLDIQDSIQLQEGERLGIKVAVENAPGSSENRVTVAGGGAAAASTNSTPMTISASDAPFGFSGFDVWFNNADGTIDDEAGSHPYSATFAVGFNTLASNGPSGGPIRNLEVNLPPGLFGDPNATPRCTRAQLDGQECPAQTQIGIDQAGIVSNLPGPGVLEVLSVYNMEPPPGVADEFAFSVAGFHAFFDVGLRSDGTYGVVTRANNLPQGVQIAEDLLTLWGTPADPSHDAQRFTKGCESGCASGAAQKPFLTLPTSCAGAQEFTIRGLATWLDPRIIGGEASTVTHDAGGVPIGFSGCERLAFEPSLTATPDTTVSDSAAGLVVDLKVPQESLSDPNGVVAATLKNTTVTLPEGVAVNPGRAAGLTACEPAEANILGEGEATCPSSSKVGTVDIKSPLLEGDPENELVGNVYVLRSNPPDVELLVTGSADGIFLKLVGHVHLNEATGRLTTTFTETPPLPFTDFKLVLEGGAQAALVTPSQCQTFSTSVDFTPWSSPLSSDVFGAASFPIAQAPSGGGCRGSLPFAPAVTAGATNEKAGAYTNFSLTLQRGDGQQRISGLQAKTPPGFVGMIPSVSLCPEPQAAQGTCGVASQVGHVVVEAGPGSYPLVLPQPGQPQAPIYLTSGYKGAPFGLSIVTPIVAGPFNLGTEVVRAKVDVDRRTGQVVVTSDPLPQIIKGVPTDIRAINTVFDRPGFLFNPTNCNPLSVSGVANSTEGVGVPFATRFQVGSCGELKFAPNFAVATSGKTSKAGGASLDAKITFPTTGAATGQATSEANIASVKVDLPKQLPSRLTTLNHACLAAVFEKNPANCPAASIVGHATVKTPVLPVPLSGPAYFVSHGGEAFPDLTLILQGDGVTIELVGSTLIRHGVTSSTFKTTPDVPFSSFELMLPQGPNSALAANGNLCQSKLSMPTLFVAQNGAEIHQTTPVVAQGCANALKVLSHKVRDNKLVLNVVVPASGKLTATAKGLSKVSKSATGRETLSLTLKQLHGGRLSTKVKLQFVPKHGKRLAKAVAARFTR